MKPVKQNLVFKALALTILLGGLASSFAQEKEELEKTRATVLYLIETLEKSVAISRSQADTMMRDAESRARARIIANPTETTSDGKKVVRVPYIPESVKTEMREQIKAEVLEETKGSRGSKKLPDLNANSRFKFMGDVRVRQEIIKMSNTNTPTGSSGLTSNTSPAVTRGADFFSDTTNPNVPFGPGFNPLQNTQRQRVRVRVGMVGELSDDVSVGLGVTTGSSSSSPTSANQTLGQGSSASPGFFSKYPVQWDRSYIRYQPTGAFEVNAGRFKNPFVGTDLVWADDMSFDGIASTLRSVSANENEVFGTMGWFPLTTFNSGKTMNRSMLGAQTGTVIKFGEKPNKFKAALGLYNFKGIEGKAEGDYLSAGSSYLSSEYSSSVRQRGNTLFRINSQSTNPITGTPYDYNNTWGLASGFKELNLTSSLDIAQFDPIHLVLTADMVKNFGYKQSDVQKRTGLNMDLKNSGYLASVKLGYPTIAQRGDWNITAAYRYLGSDAVLDAFTSADYGLGGTNTKGMSINYSLGLADKTWMSLRYISSDLIDSMVPRVEEFNNPKTKFSVDSIFIDLNARF
jgi:hypothetical protein